MVGFAKTEFLVNIDRNHAGAWAIGALSSMNSYAAPLGWIEGGTTTYPPSPRISNPGPSLPAEFRISATVTLHTAVASLSNVQFRYFFLRFTGRWRLRFAKLQTKMPININIWAGKSLYFRCLRFRHLETLPQGDFGQPSSKSSRSSRPRVFLLNHGCSGSEVFR